MGKGGNMQQTGKTTSSTDMPDWLKQGYQQIINAASGSVIDPATGQLKQAPQYQGPLQAGTNPYLQKSMDTAANMQSPDYSTVKAGMMNAAAGAEGQYQDPNEINFNSQYTAQQYNPTQFNASPVQYQNTLANFNPQASQASAAQMQGSGFSPQSYDFSGNKVTASQVNADKVTAAQAAQQNRGDIRDVSGPQGLNSYLIQKASDMQVTAPQLQQYLMQAPKDVAAERLDPAKQWTDQGVQQSYMDPYQQAVTDIAARKAKETYQQQAAAMGLKQAAAGAMGGSRAAIENSLATRDYLTQQGDIQAQGLENAYQNAQQQFERDRAAGYQTGAFNVQEGMQAALANQQAQQAAAQQNLASQLQTQGLMSGQSLQAQQFNAQNAKELALANQQAQLGTQQLGANLGQQANLSNQQADISYAGLNQAVNLANMGSLNQVNLANVQNAIDAAKANQAAGLQAGTTNLQAAQEAARMGQSDRQLAANLTQAMNQTNAGFQQQANQSYADRQMQAQQMGLNSLTQQGQWGMQAGLANQQADQWAQQQSMVDRQYGYGQNQQDRQFGATYGLNAQQAQAAARQAARSGNLNAASQAANIYQGVGGFDTQQFQNQLYANQQLGGLGQFQQQQDQAGANAAYQNWLWQQQYPMQQLASASGIMQNMGQPFMTNTQLQYQRQPGFMQQLGGLLTTGAGMAMNFI